MEAVPWTTPRLHDTVGTCAQGWAPGTEQGRTDGQPGLGLIYFLHTFHAISNVFYFPKQ